MCGRRQSAEGPINRLRAVGGTLDCRLVNHPLQMMNLSADISELRVIVSRYGFLAPALQFFDLRFDGCFVETDHLVMLVHIDSQDFAERWDKMVLVHNAVAFERVVITALGDFAKLSHGHG